MNAAWTANQPSTEPIPSRAEPSPADEFKALTAQYLGDLADTVVRYRRALEQIRREISDDDRRQPTSPMLARLDAIARKALS